MTGLKLDKASVWAIDFRRMVFSHAIQISRLFFIRTGIRQIKSQKWASKNLGFCVHFLRIGKQVSITKLLITIVMSVMFNTSLCNYLENNAKKLWVPIGLKWCFYLTIRLQARVFYEQIVNEAQPSWLSLVENEGE